MYDHNKGLIETALFNANKTSERADSLEESLEMADETAIKLFEMALAQDEINNAQDEALIELYEIIGG